MLPGPVDFPQLSSGTEPCITYLLKSVLEELQWRNRLAHSTYKKYSWKLVEYLTDKSYQPPFSQMLYTF